MASAQIDIRELHWLMDLLQSIDVGLVVLDRDHRVQVWNSFMENHSGRRPERIIGRNLFDLFPDIPWDWFRRKTESVFLLKSRAFSTWEQRPFLFRFKSYRPITGAAEFMYQNITFIPLMSADGQVNHVGVILYDVTDVAVGKNELEAANAQLEALSRTDRLTGLNNRGYWEECLVREFRRARRTRQPSTLILFDIDHFKQVNDRFGHPAGDEVIRQTAGALRHTMRETDIAGRYGGEEFGLILTGTATEGAFAVAERLRTRIEALIVRHEGHEIRYTVSLGIAPVGADMNEPGEWIAGSDQALYASKHAGRNRTTIHRKPA